MITKDSNRRIKKSKKINLYIVYVLFNRFDENNRRNKIGLDFMKDLNESLIEKLV